MYYFIASFTGHELKQVLMILIIVSSFTFFINAKKWR